MPIPPGPERIAFTADSRPLPVPLHSGQIQLGYIGDPLDQTLPDTNFPHTNRVQNTTFTYVPVTHSLPDRTFTYLVLVKIRYGDQLVGNDRIAHYDDIRALFIPTNDIKPNLEDGDWYFGREKVLGELNAGGKYGILFVSKTATIRWHGQGAECAHDLQHIMRPQLSPRDATPFDFRGIYDCCCPDTCDM